MFFLALTNPELDIFLLFSYDVGFFNRTQIPVVDAISSYPNVRLNYLNVVEYAAGSPLEEWLKSGRIFTSKFVVTHLSDVLRILTLWKYTGTYLDLDVMLTMPISAIGTNFACTEKDSVINSAIVSLDGNLGRSIAEENFKILITHFNGTSWAGNGPQILTDLLEEMCNTTERSMMTRDNCHGFQVLPYEACYPVNYENRRNLFDEAFLDEVMERTRNSFAIHFWNSHTSTLKLSTSSRSAYITFAKQFCPRVLAASGENF